MKLLDRLNELKDPNYKKFHASLCPTLDEQKIIGVKVPELRTLAKELYKEDNNILHEIGDYYYEEKMLRGLVIAISKVRFEEKIDLIERFVDTIDNWALCDIFCSSIKIKKSEKDKYFNFLKRYSKFKDEFKLRFLIVMLLDHYIDDDYLEESFNIVSKIKYDAYYVKMTVAWFISIVYIKYPQYTLNKIKNLDLDKWTYNKALQKIVESKRVSEEDKEKIKKLKVK